MFMWEFGGGGERECVLHTSHLSFPLQTNKQAITYIWIFVYHYHNLLKSSCFSVIICSIFRVGRACSNHKHHMKNK